jgi:putative membrane protein
VTTLVLCVDRANDIGRTTGVSMPVDGWDAVQSLATDVGLADPEDSTVNCLLEALSVTRDLREDGEEAVVAAVSGSGDTAVDADRSVAAQIDGLLDRHAPDSAIIVTDSADDERLIPVVESRLPVDSVDRIVVRQARDIESTYYLLKQFLADEQLRSTVLVPLGVGLLLLPVLLVRFSVGVALAGLASLLGAAVLYKGLAIDAYIARLPDQTRDALYSGQVSVVTYAVAVGLALVGAFLGALAVRPISDGVVLVPVMLFLYSSIPWLALAALTASAGRLLDELIDADRLPRPYLNLPFGVVALGLVVRGFAGYFLEREAVLDSLRVAGITVLPTHRLALLVVSAIVVSLVGVRVGARLADEGEGKGTGTGTGDPDPDPDPDHEPVERS